ncbi:hypothetical protein, partial [Methylobacterium sp. WL64]|uniref:hypothetical protein n=1 Tax=Methylobacterium sp. WL64 TaxID=2603894 RepID=UPI001AEE116D
IRTLQPQHQFDQLLAAQPLKIGTNHPTRESAKPNPRKGVGNYGFFIINSSLTDARLKINKRKDCEIDDFRCVYQKTCPMGCWSCLD